MMVQRLMQLKTVITGIKGAEIHLDFIFLISVMLTSFIRGTYHIFFDIERLLSTNNFILKSVELKYLILLCCIRS